MKHPFTLSFPTSVRDAVAVDDGMAVLTGGGIVIGDALIPSRGAERTTRLLALADGRFVAKEDRMAEIFVGVRGGELARVHPEHTFVIAVAPTPEGYIALDSHRAWLDRGDVAPAAWIPCEVAGLGSTITVWGDRLAITGILGIDAFDAAGTKVAARRGVAAKAAPFVLPDGSLAVPEEARIAVLDGNLGTALTIECGELERAWLAGETIVVESEERITAFDLDGTQRWAVSRKAPRAVVVGERVVIGSWQSPGMSIVDGATGAVLAELAVPGTLGEAVAFGDGIALTAVDHPAVVWWRPGAAVEELAHDVSIDVLRAVGDRLVTAEGGALHEWRTDGDGPEVAPVATAIPLETPLVIGNRILRIEHVGRALLRARTLVGKPVAVAPDAPWRAPIEQDTALSLVKSLAKSDYTHEELGFALGMSGRAVAAAMRARKFPLVPPVAVADYDYLGSFTTTGAIVVSDPIYTHKRAGGAISLALKVAGREGLWHVFARNGTGVDADRTSELVAIHLDGFSTYATEHLGYIGVDSGSAGIFDKQCPKRDPEAPLVEGIISGLGCVARSGHGDGSYDVFAGRHRNDIVKLRIRFLAGADIDRTFAAPKGVRKFSAKATFTLGETVEHPTFGIGTVTAVLTGNKIDIAFPEGKRTLVHGKA